MELFAFDQNGDRVRINLPLDDATVKEKRGEVYVSVGKNLSPTIRIDGGVNYEFSNLKVRGDALADRTLKFIKPNLSIDWRQPGNGWHGRLSVRRTVAQLDFYDFISVAELSTDRVNAGNENLQPQRTWEFRATAEHPFLGDGVIKLDLGYDLISMLQDRILIFDDQGQCVRRPGKYRHRQAQLRRAHRRCSAQQALDRASRQVHRHHPAHKGRRPDRRRSAQLQRLLPHLGVATRSAPRRRQVLVRLHGQRQRALHLLSDRRVRHELQRRPLRYGLLRISADRANGDHVRRRQSVLDEWKPYPAPVRSRTAQRPRTSSTSSASATATAASASR